jgi:hypothetical protein
VKQMDHVKKKAKQGDAASLKSHAPLISSKPIGIIVQGFQMAK